MDYFQLAGKKALVTGSTAGIGFAIAEVLSKAGALVIINGRSQDRIDDAIKKIKAKHDSAKLEGIAADVATAEGCTLLCERLPQVDILINNTGIFEAVPFLDTTDEIWEKHFQVNVMSGVRLSRFYFPQMIKQNWGRIIFIASEAGISITPEMIHYAMTKTAQMSIARGIAELTAGTNVTVNTVLPGPTSTEGVQQWISAQTKQQNTTNEQFVADFFKSGGRSNSLLKRFLDPTEIANAVLYVASPISSATNGATIRAEGGIIKSI